MFQTGTMPDHIYAYAIGLNEPVIGCAAVGNCIGVHVKGGVKAEWDREVKRDHDLAAVLRDVAWHLNSFCMSSCVPNAGRILKTT